VLREPPIALRMREHDKPAVEVRVNFGVFAGRRVTPAEIDRLAAALRELAPAFAIVAEDRHEFGGAVEAALHQVVVEVPSEQVAGDPEVLGERIVLAANGWARACIADRRL